MIDVGNDVEDKVSLKHCCGYQRRVHDFLPHFRFSEQIQPHHQQRSCISRKISAISDIPESIPVTTVEHGFIDRSGLSDCLSPYGDHESHDAEPACKQSRVVFCGPLFLAEGCFRKCPGHGNCQAKAHHNGFVELSDHNGRKGCPGFGFCQKLMQNAGSH